MRLILLAVLTGIIIYIITNFLINKSEDFNDYKSMINIDDPVDIIYSKLFDIVYNNEPEYRKQIDMIIKVVKPKQNWKILEAGCGVGHHGFFLKDFDYTGVDQSKSMITRAKINNPAGEYFVNDLVIPKQFPPVYFDLILCLEDTIYHNNENKRKKIFDNFYSWLKPGGFLVLSIWDDPYDYDPAPRSFTQYAKAPNEKVHAITHFPQFSHDVYLDFFKNGIIHHETFEFNTKKKKKSIKLYMDKNIVQNIIESGFTLYEIKNDELGFFKK